MGFHIIKRSEGKLESYFVDKAEDIIDIDDIEENTIVYEGDENWKPFEIKDHKVLSVFLNEATKIGKKGQQKFEELLLRNGFMFESIDQSAESISKYIANSNGKRIKRGDYYLRGKSGIEFEVKVRTLYKNVSSAYITIGYSELKSLENMQDLTGDSIFFAIFIREENIIKDDLYLISVNEIIKLNNENKLKYNSNGKYLEIPIDYCKYGIDSIKKYK